MGLARGAIALLLQEAQQRPFHGRLATLGKQTIYTSATEIARQFAKFQVEPSGAIDTKIKELDDETVFKWMGFENTTSLDYSDFEGASRIIDLNKNSIDKDLMGAFDVVLDSGTLEHVFHLPNALKNTLSLLKIGGRMIFLSPSSNHVDHGFYMFSPTLFADYFAANGFRIETMYLVGYSGNLDDLWDAYEYEPGKWRDMHIGGVDDRPYVVWAVATRLENSTVDVIPQQGFYADSNAAYAGSRLATGAIAEAKSSAPVITKTTVPAPTAQAQAAAIKSLLRRYGRHVPGARQAWRMAKAVRAQIYAFGGKPLPIAPSHGIFRKKFVGKF